MTLAAGLVGEARSVVDDSMLASVVGSSELAVLSSPSMIALMENAACRAIEDHLSPGQTTVGTRLDIRHLAATPPGVEVHARAVLVQVDGRKLIFRIESFDTAEKIGEGTHERAVVDPARLLARARAKAT